MSAATIAGRTYQVPGRFADLSGRQLVQVAALLHSGRPRPQLRLLLLLVLLRVTVRPVLAWRLLWQVSAEQRHELLLLTDFCFEEPRLTRQLLPVLRTRWGGRLYGPAAGFSNLTFSEWIACEKHFADYQRDPQRRHLDQLAAVLYRPHAGRTAISADPRRPYDPHTVAGRLPAAARQPIGAGLAVRMWYASCRLAWCRKYDGTLFDLSKQQPASQAHDPRDTWNEVLAERAGSPDRYELFGRQLLPNVLFDLDLRMRRQQEAHAALKNRR